MKVREGQRGREGYIGRGGREAVGCYYTSIVSGFLAIVVGLYVRRFWVSQMEPWVEMRRDSKREVSRVRNWIVSLYLCCFGGEVPRQC